MNAGNDKSHNDSIISQFTKTAASYHQLSEHSNQYGLELMVKLSKPQSNDKVLDVACGTGIVSCKFARFASRVTGIDLTPAMIEQAKRTQQEKQLENVTWEIGDVSRSLPFKDSSFSMVVTRYSLHHLLEPEKVLQEMKRVEKLRDPSHARALTLAELESLMGGAGLTDLEVRHQDLEMELENILQASCLNQNDADEIHLLFREDLTKNNRGMRSHLKEERIYFYFPISMVVGRKMES